MSMRLGVASIVTAMFFALGCGGDPANPDGGEGGAVDTGGGPQGGGTSQGGGSSQGGMEGDWIPIITADWQLDAGSEKTSDIHTVTIDHDMYIGAIRPIAPTGTHHTVLALGDGGFGVGNIIYASGVGTNAIYFPERVGLKVAQGETLTLQLHLFNPSADPISGTSGIEIIEIAPEDIDYEADLFLPGPLDFSIPPNQSYTKRSTCTVGTTQNVFAVFPHMHQLGTHFKSTLTVGGVETVIHDDDYTFNHQAFIPLDTVTLNPGDGITTECTWDNTTASSVTWGESSTAEMCFSILFRYPAQDDQGFCGQ